MHAPPRACRGGVAARARGGGALGARPVPVRPLGGALAAATSGHGQTAITGAGTARRHRSDAFGSTESAQAQRGCPGGQASYGQTHVRVSMAALAALERSVPSERTRTHGHARTRSHTGRSCSGARAHTYTHTRTPARPHTRTHAHTYTHARTPARTHTHTHARTYTHTHTRTHAHTHARAHTRTHRSILQRPAPRQSPRAAGECTPTRARTRTLTPTPTQTRALAHTHLRKSACACVRVFVCACVRACF